MSKKKNASTKSSSKCKNPRKSGEALRKEALATVQKNLDAIEAKERGDGAKKGGRMSKSAARAEGAARVKAASAGGKKPKAPKPAKEKRASGLDLAAKVLVESKEPLNAKTIAERAISAGWKTSGKTPHATLYAAIIREIAAKGKDARFQKTDRGLFTAGKGA